MSQEQGMSWRIPTRVVIMSLTLLGLSSAGVAARSTVPLAARTGPVPGESGTGLSSEFFDLGGFDLQNIYQVGSLVPAQPTATFMATNFDFPPGPPTTVISASTQLGAFLGLNATNLSGASSNTLAYSYFRYSGLIAIDESLDLDAGTAGIQADFQLIDDDGALLSIGGVTLGDPNEGPTTSIAEYAFDQSGLYPIQLDYYEEFGDTGLTISVAQPSFGVLSQQRLYPIPEPTSTVTLFLLASCMLRRRR